MKYTFNDSTIRELYTRSMDFDPGQEWMHHWDKMTSDEKQLIWNSLSQDLDKVEISKLEKVG
jgi:hypothetical protein